MAGLNKAEGLVNDKSFDIQTDNNDSAKQSDGLASFPALVFISNPILTEIGKLGSV